MFFFKLVYAVVQFVNKCVLTTSFEKQFNNIVYKFQHLKLLLKTSFQTKCVDSLLQVSSVTKNTPPFLF